MPKTVLYLAGAPMWAHIYGVRNGMRAAGARVFTVGTSTRGNKFHESIMDALRQYDPEFSYDLVCQPNEPIDRILAALPVQPDLILYMENGTAFLPEGIASVPIPTFGVLTEDFSHADWEPDWFPYFDVGLCSLQESVDSYTQRGHDNLEYWFMGGVDRYHRDHELPRIYDVSLIGGLTTIHRLRAKTVARILELRKEGYSVLTGYGAYFEDYSRAYSQCKIVLNRSACDQFNMRVFEAAACGALVVTNRPRNAKDPNAHFLVDRQHVVYYDSDEEAVKLVRHYLQNDGERRRIAAAGKEQVLAHHTYLHVANDFFDRIVPTVGNDFLARREERLRRWGIDEVRQRLDYAKHFYLRQCPDISEQYYRQADHQEPTAITSLGLALSAALQGNHQAAEKQLSVALDRARTEPERLLVRVNSGSVNYFFRSQWSKGQPEAALSEALRAVRSGAGAEPPSLRDWLYFPPVYDRYRMELSFAYWRITSLAERWRRIRTLADYQLSLLLGELRLERQQAREAIEALTEAVRLLPDDGQALSALARAYLLLGDRESAVKHLRKALQEAPFNSEAQRLLDSLEKLERKNGTDGDVGLKRQRFKPGISAIVHTLNEEAKIEDALKSLQGWVDEIIVCDMYSDDKTVEIARRYTDRIIFHKRERFVEPARSFAASHAQHEWLFLLDADERIPRHLATYLRKLVESNPTDFDALSIPMDDRWMGRKLQLYESQWPVYKSPQLLRNGSFRFSDRVHEPPLIRGQIAQLQPNDKSDAITHLAWDGLRHWMAKINNYTDGEAEKLDALGRRFRWRDAIRAFVEGLSVTYDRGGQLDGALGLIVSFCGANYRFYQHAKLHERHMSSGSLTPEENEAPKDVVEMLEYAVQVARELDGSRQVEPPAQGKSAAPVRRQRFSLYHTEGREDALKAWMAPYADLFRGADRVLDVGCGPGLFLELLRERGIHGHGVDYDQDMVDVCKSKGLSASVSDARSLASNDQLWDGIHLGHIIEHLDGDAAVELMERCVAALRPGGVLLVRTPNWGNETVRNGGFWLDHTHVRPYPLELLERIFIDMGLEVAAKGHEPAGWQDTYILGRKLPIAQTPRKVATRPTQLPAKLAIVWEGSQFVHHSLALVNRELCLQLLESGQELSIVPYEPDQFGPELDTRFAKLSPTVRSRLSRPADVHVRHQWPPDFSPPPEGCWVMIQPWEFGSLPKAWVGPMKAQVDEIWVPSHFVKECYVQSGLPEQRVQVIPNGVDTGRFHPGARPTRLKTRKSYKFLFVGGTIARKGPDILLDAYTRAFTGKDDVCLVIKDMGGQTFYRGQTLAERIRRIQSTPNAPEILYLTNDMSPRDLPGLYTACNCLVQPYRGEGFGLPIAEAMACGLPVIVTGAGAALDFCDDTTAMLIPATKVVLPERRVGDLETVDFPFLFEPDRDVTARLMREMFENRSKGRAIGARARQRIVEGFTWKHAAQRVVDRVRELQGRQPLRFQDRTDCGLSRTKPDIEMGSISTTTKAGSTQAIETVEEPTSMADSSAAQEPIEDRLLIEGQSALERGDHEGALRAFTKLVELFPELAVAHVALATTLTAAGRLGDAVSPLRRALALSPHDASIHNQLGVALYQSDDPEGAEEAFLRAQQLDPQDVDPILNLIHLYRSQGRAEKASAAIKAALAVDAQNPDVLASFAGLCIELGDLEGAEMGLARLEGIAPGHPDLLPLRDALTAAQTERREDASPIEA